jgi:nitroimidazol reductase NimA-like FMN-containing flavoprotein (pyridoxamine 5'-phosphate oxidase superfamily)
MKTTSRCRSVLGPRLLSRRLELGLTRGEVARRAGVDGAYVAYLEEQGGEPSGPVLLRLAAALHTTAESLVAAAPVQGARRLELLGEDDCWILLSRVPVGRVAFARAGETPLIHPVNHAVVDRHIVIRTGERTQLAYAARAFRRVSYQVDRLDEDQRSGWTVLVTGAARVATPAETAGLHVDELLDPWAAGDRPTVVVIRPERVTGRRIVPPVADVSGDGREREISTAHGRSTP